ncbi:MAG TPA: hypothetical protein VG650_16315 [Mycobacteriales bacterium]|nr:hypothetical protein [Mycobacteriales bacterium]
MKPTRAYGVLGAIFVAGFATFGWSWHGARHAMYVPLQLPWMLSGGLGGLALTGLSATSWHIYATKRDNEKRRAEWDAFAQELIGTLSRPELVE